MRFSLRSVSWSRSSFLALLYSQLRLRGWTDERARAALKKAGWVL